MRKLIRLLAGVVLLGALLAVANVSPALAKHGQRHQGQLPEDDLKPSTTGGSHDDSTGGWHEEQPDLAVAAADDRCVVTGTVDPGRSFENDAHFPSVPLVNDNPSHSHFQFIDTTITCIAAGELSVRADGGNDGHMIDLFCGTAASPDPTCGDPTAAGWTPLEADLDSTESLNICSTVHPDLCLGNPKTDTDGQHEFNTHHGSVNESAWSHSGDYSGNDTTGAHTGESNACGPDDNTKNYNKADIGIVQVNPPNNTASGWVKYIRIGVVVYAWGCAPGLDANDRFSTVLVILPNVLPADPTNTFPANPLNPVCPFESIVHLTPPCGFILVGVAWRGASWL